MIKTNWALIGCLGLVLAVTLQLGASLDTIVEEKAPNYTTALNGNCSKNQFLYCDLEAICTELVNNQSYCKCPEANTGDGLKNGTGCGKIIYNCHDNSGCHPYATCVNRTCKCKDGYRGNGNTCNDIDECDIENPCPKYSLCHNEPGSYNCTCQPRFERIGSECIFKCRVNRDCHANGRCENQECQCLPGFAGDGIGSCDNINECTEGSFECSPDANCQDTEGDYTCVCKDGFSGDGKICERLPTSCDEIFRNASSSPSGKYIIDTDGTGPVKAVEVTCDMRKDMGITVIYPNDENVRKSKGSGEDLPVPYTATPDQIKPLVDGSQFCSQEFWIKCASYYDLAAHVSWTDDKNNTRTGWGTSHQGTCPCGVLGVCRNPKSVCNCDGQNPSRSIDTGIIVDKAELPAVEVKFDNNGRIVDWTVGPLKCGPKPIDILKNCHEIKQKLKVKLSGPQLIDVDGPNGPLDPILVHCDMESNPNLGITVIPHDGNEEVEFTETGSKPINYLVPLPAVEALIKGSVFCDQSWSYECQNGKQDVKVGIGQDGRPLSYLPGGLPDEDGSCGCGVTDTCEERGSKCNCAIDDGKTRKDFGIQIDRNDLPIVSVNVSFNGQKKGVSFVGPIRCSNEQFGIEANCEKYRSVGKQDSYTYLIDPDGPPTDGNGNVYRRRKKRALLTKIANVAPFHAQCVMQSEPPMGITIIQHNEYATVRFNRGSKDLALNYRYVTKDQLMALKTRCTYVQQHVKLTCNKFQLHPSGPRGKFAKWTALINNFKYTYWSGNGTHTNCEGPGGEDVCQCDSSNTATTPLVDEGDLTNKNAVPLGKIQFYEESITGDGYLDAEIGPFKCFEVFKTCTDVYSAARRRIRFGESLPENGRFTIDPDGSGGVDAFQVDCKFPRTILPATPGGDSLQGTGTDPVEECFDITYLDGGGKNLSPEQVVQLVKASNGKCNQKLSLKCTNAPITDLISFTTCDGVKQPGWAGSGGVDKCACGVTGTCKGSRSAKCNCDVEDGKEHEDGAIIVDNARIPVCKVCIKLNGTLSDPSNPNPSRSASFTVSNLVCSNGVSGVRANCQDARTSSFVSSSSTIYVRANPRPVPVFCDYRAFPPAGVFQMFPKEPNITIPPNQPIDEVVEYYSFNLTEILPLLDNFEYCTQKIEMSCQDAALSVQGQFGWYNRQGAVQSYWVEPLRDGVPCTGNNGLCNCNLPGSQEDGGLIIDQTALPVTRIKLEASSGTRNVFLGPVECYDIKKDCYEIMKSRNKRTVYWRNSTYVIDPDGPGGVDPFIAVCKFDESNDNAITMAYPIDGGPKTVTGTDSKDFEIPLNYPGATPEQLNELAKHSKFCMQGVLYECRESPIGSLKLADGDVAPGFGLADDITTKGCPCGKLGTCGTNNTCRCDNKGPMGDFDRGVITAKDELPVVSASFGGQSTPNAVGKATITSLNCSRIPDGLPENCQEAAEMGMTSGEILVYPSSAIPPFLVYCDMNLVPGKGIARVKPVDDPDKPVNSPNGTTDVPYKGLTDEQLRILIETSTNCYQPVLVDCFKTGFIKDGSFSWKGLDGQTKRYWGSGSNLAQTCSCGDDGMCGGVGGKDDMSQRKCNCEIGDAVWRKDGGVLSVKVDLPIRSYTYTTPGSNGAQANMTIGDLYCGMQEIDLPVCDMDFDDCAEEAECENKRVSDFNCHCKQGYQGLIRGQGINDVWANGRECFDDDECSYLRCAYSSVCFNYPGDFNCTCKEGYRTTGKTTCEDINECTEGTHDCNKDAKCENLDGSFICKCKRGFVGDGRTCDAQGQCVCFGDPHCLSFDEKWLDYMGLCEYTMSRDNCGAGEPTYEVIMNSWDKELNVQYAAWVKGITIKYKGTVVEMRQGREIRVNGQIKAGYSGNGFSVIDTGREAIFSSNINLTVAWDGKDKVQIFVDKKFQQKTCGICGNYNNDAKDDWTIGPGCPNAGQITTNNNEFGTSWASETSAKRSPKCKRDCDEPPSMNPPCGMSQQMAAMMCGYLLGLRTSVFKDCIPKINSIIMEGLYRSCNIDMCRSPQTAMDNMCATAGRVADECRAIGEQIPVWRNANGLRCGESCGVNMVYSVCGGMADTDPGPVQTCLGMLTNATEVPSKSCLDGCFCKDGYYKDKDHCVPAAECGCIYEENNTTTYMEAGETVVNDGCGAYRICNEGNVFNNKSLVCDPDAECDLNLELGVYGCHCKAGFMGDGEKCEEDPCYNVNCTKNQECKAGKCVCKMGYTADCETCVDIDECATRTHNCTKPGQECRNIDGGAECICKEGYYGVEDFCLDFDECATGKDNCPPNSECKNTRGGFECVCCGGFKKQGLQCVSDGSGFESVGNGTICCSCFGESCSNPGKVCGSDGKTYNSEKELIIKACKNQNFVEKSYDGPCRDDCANTECELPSQVCVVENGKAKCQCPVCTESEANVTIEAVCSSTHLMFKSRCDFDKYTCGIGNSEITIVSTGKECEGSGAGYPMAQWGPWGPCSVTCGTGFESRTRVPLGNALDSNGNPLKETAIALCYRTCPEGPCTATTCPKAQVCVSNNETSSTNCTCRKCDNRGYDPVCGRVGNFVRTYVNLCELEKDACVKTLPMTIVQDFACEVKPVNCSKMAAWGSRKDDKGCESIFMDFGQCGGGCGQIATKCCTPKVEQQSIQVKCIGQTAYNTTMDVITSCDCEETKAPSSTPRTGIL
ncbi:uncharacterized protein LOC124278610 isoform X1 [Haliotis rubra]|uniref:uncharacterized protein LOC124278610 isoform X1 n=1 Tax=Haliotis rubra TaxID=36100 RepID=UPI001EE5FBAF|nr:uncharacterized protein LOC124278610 isoform X1 [Haliotis rubra]